MKHCIALLALLLAGAPQAQAQGLTPGQPEEAGFSADRLARVDSLLDGCVRADCIPGIVALVARDGKVVYHRAFGQADVAANRPMAPDAIFRIASMTKAITSVAVMMLYEEGRFSLNDPVSLYIPEFKNPRVLTAYNAADTSYTSEPARREITVRDLLTHTSGIAYGFIHPELGAVYKKARIPDSSDPRPVTIGEKVRALAGLPLASHPGEKFVYGLNTDVLGYFVEVVSGMPFDRFLRERLFDPLGMDDTYFYLPDGKAARLAAVYQERDGRLRPYVPGEPTALGLSPADVYVKGGKSYFSGGAGLASTAMDYARFAQMLLNGGELDGARILGPKTLELMLQDHLDDFPWGKGSHMGLGFEVIDDLGEYAEAGSEGTFRWGGYYNTEFWIDPQERLVAVYMTQVNPTSRQDIFRKFRTLVYSAIEESYAYPPDPGGRRARRLSER